jgi:hypothetical protein
MTKTGLVCLCLGGAVWFAACGGGRSPANLKELRRVQSGNLDVVLLSPDEGLTQGNDSFVLEFRNRGDQQLVDVGTVGVNATMSMPGMAPMLGTTSVKPAGTPGRYEVDAQLTMSGSWRIDLDWNGPAGKGSTTLDGQVQ